MISVTVVLLFLEFHINKTRQYVVFGVWLSLLSRMFLRFSYIVASISNQFLSMTEWYFVIWMYHSLFNILLLKDIWVGSIFFNIMNSAAMIIGIQIFMWTQRFCLGRYLGLELVDYKMKCFWRHLSSCFSKCLHHFAFSSAMQRVLASLRPYRHLVESGVRFWFLILVILMGM